MFSTDEGAWFRLSLRLQAFDNFKTVAMTVLLLLDDYKATPQITTIEPFLSPSLGTSLGGE